MTESIKNIEKKKGIIPTKIALQNFMSHKNSAIDFGDLTVINSSKNGEGKTAILEGLQYALTGQTLRTMDGLKMENLIRRGASRSNVVVEGIQKDTETSPEKSFFLKRTRGTKGTKINLRIDGEECDDPKEYLEDEVDPKSFAKLTYINGHDILSFMKGTPKDRDALLDNLFGIDVLQSLKDSLSTSSLEKEILKIDRKLAEIETEKTLIERSRLLLNEMLGLERTKETLEETIDSIREEIGEEISKETTAKEVIETYQQRSEKIKEIQAKITVHQEVLENLNAELRGETAKNSRLEERLTSLEERIEDGNIDEIIDKKTREKNKILEIIQSEESVPSVIDLLYNSIERDGESECPVCGNSCTLEELERQRSRFSSLYEEHKEQLNFVNSEIMNLSGLKTRIEKVQTKKSATADMIRKLENDANKEEREILRLETVVNAIISETDIDEELFEFNKNILENRKSYSLKGRLDELEKELEMIENKLEEATEVTESGTADMDIPDSSDLEDKKDRILSLIDKFNRYKEILVESLKDIREKTLEKVNRIINTFLGFFEQTVLDKITMKVIRKIYRGNTIYQYDIQIIDKSGREIPFESLSTGQKSSAMLSLIMSMNDISTNTFPVILFDEIQACGLDSDSILTMISMIATLSEVKNIIITSRDDGIVKDIQEEVQRVTDDGESLVHNINTKIYTCKLIENESGIPETEVSEYA